MENRRTSQDVRARITEIERQIAEDGVSSDALSQLKILLADERAVLEIVGRRAEDHHAAKPAGSPS